MENLSGIAIFERDFSGDHLLTWCFPGLEKMQENLIHEQLTYLSKQDDLTKKGDPNISQENTSISKTPGFFFSRYLSNWHYIQRYNIPEDSKNKDITQKCMVVLAKDLHPGKYQNLLKTLVDIFFIHQKKKTTTYLLQHYLSAFGTGRIKHSPLPFDAKEFKFGVETDSLLKRMRKTSSQEDEEENPFNGTPVDPNDLKKVVQFFTPDTFVTYVWTSLLVRRKVLLFSQDHDKVQLFLSVLPWLVCHQRALLDVRLIFDFDCEVEVEEMQTLLSYLVGTETFPPMEDEVGYIDFDIFIDLDAVEEERKIVVSSRARDLYQNKTGIHQEMIRYLTEVKDTAEEGDNGEDIVRTINEQNTKVIKKLKMLHKKFEGELTIEDFKQIGMSPDLEAFLILVATAEGLITME